MKYENTQQAIAALKKLEQTQAAYDHVMNVLYLDATTVAPSDSWEGRGSGEAEKQPIPAIRKRIPRC